MKNKPNTFLINQIRIAHDTNCIIFAHIAKVSSVSISFNINKPTSSKVIAFSNISLQPLQRYGSYFKPISFRHVRMFVAYNSYKESSKKNLWIELTILLKNRSDNYGHYMKF